MLNFFRSRRTEQRSISFQSFWGEGGASNNFSIGHSIDQALHLLPVYAATSIVADLMAQMVLEGFRQTSDGVKSKLTPQPSLFQQPTLFGGPPQWTHRAVISLALKGNAYGLIMELDRTGWPSQIEWLHPDQVTIKNDYAVDNPQFFWLGRPIDNSMLIHIPYYSVPGRVLGLSPIKQYRDVIEQGILAQRFGNDYFKNGSVPAGILTTEQRIQNEDQAERIRLAWKQKAGHRDIAVLGSGAAYQQISVNPDESQFIETMKFTATQIAAIYKLPPEMVSGTSGDSMTYANIESRRSDIAYNALMPYAVRIEDAISRLAMPRGQYAKYNFDSYIRADMLDRYQAYGLALQYGWMTDDEVRAKEDLPPLTAKQREQVALAPSTPGPTLGDKIMQKTEMQGSTGVSTQEKQQPGGPGARTPDAGGNHGDVSASKPGASGKPSVAAGGKYGKPTQKQAPKPAGK